MFHRRSSFRKFSIFFFKIPKMPKIFPKCIQTFLNVFWGQIFEKILCPVFHGGSNLRKFPKKSKNFPKFQKRPKSFPKESKRVLIVIWDNFSEKILPSFPWKVESSKFFKKKSKNFQNSKNAQNCSQKYPNVF